MSLESPFGEIGRARLPVRNRPYLAPLFRQVDYPLSRGRLGDSRESKLSDPWMVWSNARGAPIPSQEPTFGARQLFTLTDQLSDKILGGHMPSQNTDECARPRSVKVSGELTQRID